MEPQQVIEVLDGWNFWTKDQDIGIERKEYRTIIERLHRTSQIVVLTGVRRSGKSTLLKQYIHFLIRQGMDRKDCLYINFEEPKFIGQLSLDFLQQSYEAYREIVQPKGKPAIFLDEVQLIPGWEKFVRGIHEKNEAAVFVSGSSATLLSSEFATVLTGRHVDLKVFPLRFREFLNFKNVTISSQLDLLAHKPRIRQLLWEYLEYGGFPLVVLKEEKKEILTAYFDDILTKDVAERHHIKKTAKLKSLATFYLSNASSLASFRKIKDFLGLSLDSVERFSSYLQEAYIVFLMNKFSYSLKEQEVNPKKAYGIDNGLKNIMSFRFRENIGQLYENTIFLELLQRGKELYYWKGKGECDFVIKEGQKIIAAIQVSYLLTTRKEQEVQSLLEALEEFKLNEGLIITGEYEGREQRGNKSIVYIPLWKWLLA